MPNRLLKNGFWCLLLVILSEAKDLLLSLNQLLAKRRFYVASLLRMTVFRFSTAC
jgi:hypothetical protein